MNEGACLARKVAATVALIALSTIHSQSAVEAWVQRYSHPTGSSAHARKAATDAFGNVILAGYADGRLTGIDFLVVKYAGSGDPFWTNRFNGTGNDWDQATDVAVDGEGNVFVTGWTYSGDGNLDYATVAYSGTGAPLWTNLYDGPAHGLDQANAVAVDHSGNVLVTGSSGTIAYSGVGVPLWTNSGAGNAIAAGGSGNVFITGSSLTIAYSSAGVPLWMKDGAGGAIAVDGSDNVFVTGSSATIAFSGVGVPLWTNSGGAAIAVDNSGNVFVTGSSATIAYSGAGVPLWTNSGAGTAIAVDGNGIVFVVGTSSSSGTSDDYRTVAYSGAGVPLWTNRFNGPVNGIDQAFAAAVDSNGKVFVTGESKGPRDFDFATIAYLDAGVPLWTNRCKGPGNGDDQPAAVVLDGSGNVFVTGSSYDGGSGADYATVAYSDAGVPLWTNRYNGPANGDDVPVAMAVDANGKVFVTGYSSGSGRGFDYATVAYSGVGVPLWTNRFDGNSQDLPFGIAVDSSGNVFVTGRSHSFASSFDFATVAYSGAGVPLWTNRYNGQLNDYDEARAIAVDSSSGKVFVTGNSSVGFEDSEYATVAYSGAGVPLWTNRYNGPVNRVDVPLAIAVGGNGNVFVTGRSYGSGTDADYATVAYSGAGVPLWTNRYNGPGNDIDQANAIAVDDGGKVFVTGSSMGSGGGFGYATVAYSSAGVPLWTNRYDAPLNGSEEATAIAVDGAGTVFVTGHSRVDGVNTDYATAAYSGAGVPLWTNRYDGPAHGPDRPLTRSCLAIGPSGAVVVTGSSDGDFTEGTTYDYATIKYVSSAIPPIRLNFQTVGNLLVLSWTNAAFKLQSAPGVQGTYVDVPGATSPHGTPFSGAQRFFRLRAD